MNDELIRVWFSTPDKGFGQVVGSALGAGFEIGVSESLGDGGFEQESEYDTLLLDLRTTADQPEYALQRIDAVRRSSFPPPIIVIVDDDDPSQARNLIEAGAFDTITTPPNIVELRLLLRRARRFRSIEQQLKQARSQRMTAGKLDELIGGGRKMQETFVLAQKIAPCDVSVLITGETGTGKSMLARTIHRLSSRSAGPFVSFSCPNLMESLVEDELFGHEKGAFTGALSSRRGRFEAANGGTLFLDEIGDLPLALQAKLLRVLQERSFERLGSNTPVSVDIRVIGATHRNLEEMVKRGEFREDLYYRLNVIQLNLPPLRERSGGIPVLAQHFLDKFAREFGKSVQRLSRPVLKSLEEYSWPGNVRELENVIQRAVVLCDDATVELWHLPEQFRGAFEEPQAGHLYEDEVREFKRRLLVRTLRECGGNKAESARALGLARGYLHRLINELKIEQEETFVPPPAMQQEAFPKRVM